MLDSLRVPESGTDGAGSYVDNSCIAEPDGESGMRFGSKGVSGSLS